MGFWLLPVAGLLVKDRILARLWRDKGVALLVVNKSDASVVFSDTRIVTRLNPLTAQQQVVRKKLLTAMLLGVGYYEYPYYHVILIDFCKVRHVIDTGKK
jgi:hypothetical protein